jgi:hypothetical protein
VPDFSFGDNTMSWRINLIKNTVKINSKIALELYQSDAQIVSAWQDECTFPDLEGIISGENLVFNPDHMEHMDYIWEDEILNVLKRNRVEGDICFSSNDGDNKCKKWGYRFDGQGGMKNLKGKEIFEEKVKSPKKNTKMKAERQTKSVHPLADVRFVIDNEGFDYAFRNYSDFPEIKDKKFHVLRKAYVLAAEALANYVGE